MMYVLYLTLVVSRFTISLELQNIKPTSAVPTNVGTVNTFSPTKQPMTMLNANTNQDEDNNSRGWKQVGSGKATGSDRADKTINGIKKEDGMAI
jgi:hypothetical protein